MQYNNSFYTVEKMHTPQVRIDKCNNIVCLTRQFIYIKFRQTFEFPYQSNEPDVVNRREN